jgi:hypothetical protein
VITLDDVVKKCQKLTFSDKEKKPNQYLKKSNLVGMLFEWLISRIHFVTGNRNYLVHTRAAFYYRI